MGLSMSVVAVLAAVEANKILVPFLVIFLMIFQLTIGTYLWVYLGLVVCDEGLSIYSLVLWTFCLVISLSTPSMFTGLGSSGTFILFACSSLVSALLLFYLPISLAKISHISHSVMKLGLIVVIFVTIDAAQTRPSHFSC